MSDNLRKLQQSFSAAVTAADTHIYQSIESDASGDAKTRIGIYSDAYVLRLIEALQTDFSGLHELLGDEQFDAMAREYIAANPSTFRSVRWFAGKLPEFLRNTKHYADQAVIAEMAEFEWAKCSSFDAPDSTLFTLEALAQLPPEQWGEMTFEFTPSLQRLNFYSNAPAMWLAFDGKTEVPDIATSEYPTAWVVWRKGLDPHWSSLEVDEAWTLDQSLQGASFSEICEGICEWVDTEHAAMRAVSILKSWVTEEMLANIQISA